MLECGIYVFKMGLKKRLLYNMNTDNTIIIAIFIMNYMDKYIFKWLDKNTLYTNYCHWDMPTDLNGTYLNHMSPFQYMIFELFNSYGADILVPKYKRLLDNLKKVSLHCNKTGSGSKIIYHPSAITKDSHNITGADDCISLNILHKYLSIVDKNGYDMLYNLTDTDIQGIYGNMVPFSASTVNSTAEMEDTLDDEIYKLFGLIVDYVTSNSIDDEIDYQEPNDSYQQNVDVLESDELVSDPSEAEDEEGEFVSIGKLYKFEYDNADSYD